MSSIKETLQEAVDTAEFAQDKDLCNRLKKLLRLSEAKKLVIVKHCIDCENFYEDWNPELGMGKCVQTCMARKDMDYCSAWRKKSEEVSRG